MAPAFRADQVGSLLRPIGLLQARNEHDIPVYTSIAALPVAIQAATRDAIAAAVDKQLALGIRPLTTGELERAIFYSGFFETLSGLTVFPALHIPSAFRTNFCTIAALQRAGVVTRPGVVATGLIRRTDSAYREAWELLKSFVPRELWPECKITMPSPTWQHMQLAKGTAFTAESGYTSDEAYFADMAAVYREEMRELYDAGLRHVQIDDPNLTFFVVDSFREGCIADGVDPDELLAMYIRAHNACLADRPPDLHVGVHRCRGNMQLFENGVASGSYERIAERVLEGMDYDAFYLEYDDERSGDFEPLRFLPVGKIVVLGLVSTKRTEMEALESLERRVREAARVIATGQGRTVKDVLADSVAVSPQCGFASQSQGNSAGMAEKRMWEKLVLVRDLARKVWAES